MALRHTNIPEETAFNNGRLAPCRDEVTGQIDRWGIHDVRGCRLPERQ